MLAVPAALRASLGKSLATFTTMPAEFAEGHIKARGFDPPAGAGRDPSISLYSPTTLVTARHPSTPHHHTTIKPSRSSNM